MINLTRGNSLDPRVIVGHHVITRRLRFIGDARRRPISIHTSKLRLLALPLNERSATVTIASTFRILAALETNANLPITVESLKVELFARLRVQDGQIRHLQGFKGRERGRRIAKRAPSGYGHLAMEFVALLRQGNAIGRVLQRQLDRPLQSQECQVMRTISHYCVIKMDDHLGNLEDVLLVVWFLDRRFGASDQDMGERIGSNPVTVSGG